MEDPGTLRVALDLVVTFGLSFEVPRDAGVALFLLPKGLPTGRLEVAVLLVVVVLLLRPAADEVGSSTAVSVGGFLLKASAFRFARPGR